MTENAPVISLYVHWPFCLAKCPYCDFNSHVADDIDTKSWQRALLTDLERQAEKAYQQLSPDCGRIYSSLKLDIRKGKDNRLKGKVKSIEEKIGQVKR